MARSQTRTVRIDRSVSTCSGCSASEFNTSRCSCEIQAQKDTAERRYVPRLNIRPTVSSSCTSFSASSSSQPGTLSPPHSLEWKFLSTRAAHHSSDMEKQRLHINFGHDLSSSTVRPICDVQPVTNLLHNTFFRENFPSRTSYQGHRFENKSRSTREKAVNVRDSRKS